MITRENGVCAVDVRKICLNAAGMMIERRRDESTSFRLKCRREWNRASLLIFVMRKSNTMNGF